MNEPNTENLLVIGFWGTYDPKDGFDFEYRPAMDISLGPRERDIEQFEETVFRIATYITL